MTVVKSIFKPITAVAKNDYLCFGRLLIRRTEYERLDICTCIFKRITTVAKNDYLCFGRLFIRRTEYERLDICTCIFKRITAVAEKQEPFPRLAFPSTYASQAPASHFLPFLADLLAV